MKIDLINSINNFNYSEKLSQEEYDLIQNKDPKKIYIVNDKIYFGDHLLNNVKSNHKYLLGPANINNEYIIYLNMANNNSDHLVEIAKFKGAQNAINALNKYNNIGSHMDNATQINQILISYIQEHITLHELIIGIISSFNWKDSAQLQEVLAFAITHGILDYKNKYDLPITLKDDLLIMKNDSNPLFKIYSDLYDLIIKYKCFTNLKFKKNIEDLNLSKAIKEITNIVVSP
jgi:hypothetical protein